MDWTHTPLIVAFWATVALYPVILWLAARLVRPMRVRMAGLAREILDDHSYPADLREAVELAMTQAMSPTVLAVDIAKMPVRMVRLVSFVWREARVPRFAFDDRVRRFVKHMQWSRFAANPLLGMAKELVELTLLLISIPCIVVTMLFHRIERPRLSELEAVFQISYKLAH